jgi:hypothetical protein
MPQKSTGASCFPTRRASAAGNTKRHPNLFPACRTHCSISSCPLARCDLPAECSRAAAQQAKTVHYSGSLGMPLQTASVFLRSSQSCPRRYCRECSLPSPRVRRGMNNKPVICFQVGNPVPDVGDGVAVGVLLGDACDGTKKSRAHLRYQFYDRDGFHGQCCESIHARECCCSGAHQRLLP